MGFETLSCAIARVIIHYHAHRTQTPPLSIDALLKNPMTEINKTLATKIIEATTNNNSSRRTLLQYMHFGFSLSEKVRMTENPEDIEAIKSQLIQFIQNIQRLLTTTGFLTRTLTLPTLPEKSLSVFLLDHSTSKAQQLTQQLLIDIKLSPQSTDASIQETINELFLAQTNQTLIRQNTRLTCELDSLNKTLILLEAKLALLQGKSESSQEHAIPIDFTDDNNDASDASDAGDEMKNWESISLTDLDLTLENDKLAKRQTQLLSMYETADKKIKIFNQLITKLEQRSIRSTPRTNDATYCALGLFNTLNLMFNDEDTTPNTYMAKDTSFS